MAIPKLKTQAELDAIEEDTCGTCYWNCKQYKWVNGRKHCDRGHKYIYSKKQKACKYFDTEKTMRFHLTLKTFKGK